MVESAVLRDPSERVSPRARLRWLVGALGGGATLVAAAAVVAAWRAEVAWWVLVPVVLAVVGYVAVVPQWRYLVHRWEVTDTALYTQTGWWARERRIAPMSRIQTVDYNEDALDRLFGLATVTATTASSAGPVRIVGLDAELARRLTDELTRKADAVAGDAT